MEEKEQEQNSFGFDISQFEIEIDMSSICEI